jgi:hypothetical protein
MLNPEPRFLPNPPPPAPSNPSENVIIFFFFFFFFKFEEFALKNKEYMTEFYFILLNFHIFL